TVDTARKGGSKPELSTQSASTPGPQLFSGSRTSPVLMGAAAPAAMEEAANELTTAPIETLSPAAPTELDPDEHTAASPQLSLVDHLRAAILNALSAAGHRMLVSILEVGQWRVEPNEVVIKVAASPTVIDMSLGADARRIAVATASGVLGR